MGESWFLFGHLSRLVLDGCSCRCRFMPVMCQLTLYLSLACLEQYWCGTSSLSALHTQSRPRDRDILTLTYTYKEHQENRM